MKKFLHLFRDQNAGGGQPPEPPEEVKQPVESEQPQDNPPEAPAQKTPEQQEEEARQKAETDAHYQKRYVSLTNRIKRANPALARQVIGDVKKEFGEPAPKPTEFDDNTSVMDMPWSEFQRRQTELTRNTISEMRRQEAYQAEIAEMHLDIEAVERKYNLTQEQKNQIVAEAQTMFTPEMLAEPGGPSRLARMVFTITENLDLKGNLNKNNITQRAAEEAKVRNAMLTQQPEKAAPGQKTEPSPKMAQLERMQKVAPQGSASLLDSNRK